MLIAQVLGIVNSSIKARSEYNLRVLNGTEKPLSTNAKRVLRLTGAGSDVTEVSMSHTPQHIQH